MSELQQPLNQVGDDQKDKFDKASLSDLFGVQDIYAHDNAKQSESLSKLLREYEGTECLINGLNSHTQKGIQDSEVQERQLRWGNNKPNPKIPKTTWDIIKEALSDTILQILMAATVVSLITGYIQDGAIGLIDGFSIIIAIVIIVLVTLINEKVKEKQFLELSAKSERAEAIVIRGGVKKTIDANDLVVGDIVVLELGKSIPADIIVFETNELACNESSMTGEPDSKKKLPFVNNNQDPQLCPFILKSTLIESGNGKGVVCAVGTNTQIGKLEQLLMADQDDTPLQEKLTKISTTIGYFGLAAAVLTFFALCIRGSITIGINHEKFFTMNTLNGILNAFILGVTIIVVAIPEGLPLAVTISLAYSVGKMFEDKNLVRHLHASETMGGANEICTDKTGTLTMNKMSVQALYTNMEQQDVKKDHEVDKILQECVLYNCSAHVEMENSMPVAKGNVTECGILEYFLNQKVQVEDILSKLESEKLV